MNLIFNLPSTLGPHGQDVTLGWTMQKQNSRHCEFRQVSSTTAMTLPCTRISSFHIHWITLSICHLGRRLWKWEPGIWREIGWYTSRTTGGLKEERKKERYIGVSRRRMFLIFPDFTVGTMCVMKYATGKARDSIANQKITMDLVPGQARSDIIEWL